MTSEESKSELTCGLTATLRVIAGKWKPLIVYYLLPGSKRYSELRRAALGVSDKVLIQQLKELEADAVLKRRDYQEVPPRVDYTLTPLGHTLAKALIPLCDWGTENMAELRSIEAKRIDQAQKRDAETGARPLAARIAAIAETSPEGGVELDNGR
jgi:DNA-binding HxlR family transcriptional regulator